MLIIYSNYDLYITISFDTSAFHLHPVDTSEDGDFPALKLKVKECPRCKTIKPISEFCKNVTKMGGLDTYCKECSEQILAEYRKTPEGKIYIANKAHRRRQREMENHGESDISLEQWVLSLEEVGYTCPMCGKPFTPKRKPTIDHIYPLSLGGDLSYWNVQPLCRACNSAKCDRVRPDHEIRKAQTIATRLATLISWKI